MVSARERTKTVPKDDKIIALITCLTKLENTKTSVLATVQGGGGGNRTQTRTNTKVRDPNNSYVEVINNIESWRVRKSKDKIKMEDQDWYL